MTRTELIAALENAEGPDRTWDTLIWECVGLSEVEEYHCKIWCSQDGRKDISRGMFLDAWAPEFTSSIDAALTLVPDDPANSGKPMLWSICYDEDGVAGKRGYVGCLGKGYHDPHYIYGHSTASPAIALCIAALKARGETP